MLRVDPLCVSWWRRRGVLAPWLPPRIERASVSIRLGSGCRSRLLVEHVVSRRRSLMSRPKIACGSARLAAIPPVRARAAITVAVLCAALSGGFALDVRADRNAIYQPATSRFSQNVSLRAPVATRDGEPSIRVDVRGNCYVGAIRGVPAGVDLWRFDLNPASPTFDPGRSEEHTSELQSRFDL